MDGISAVEMYTEFTMRANEVKVSAPAAITGPLLAFISLFWLV